MNNMLWHPRAPSVSIVIHVLCTSPAIVRAPLGACSAVGSDVLSAPCCMQACTCVSLSSLRLFGTVPPWPPTRSTQLLHPTLCSYTLYCESCARTPHLACVGRTRAPPLLWLAGLNNRRCAGLGHSRVVTTPTCRARCRLRSFPTPVHVADDG